MVYVVSSERLYDIELSDAKVRVIVARVWRRRYIDAGKVTKKDIER